ncbi:MAG: hypothetical protein ACUVSX_08735 [Aggregatilineales bacterium]
MSRVINTDSTGKRRSQLMRTVAETLRRLSQKNTVDDDTRDMVALLVFCLRDIEAGIEQSAQVWEKRDYWMKAEEFRERWRWAGLMAAELQELVFADNWGHLPNAIARLLPYVSDIKINKFTRREGHWKGSYDALLREKPLLNQP